MRNFLTFLCSFFTVILYAQDPVLVWAKSMAGGASDQGNAIALDATGNVYTTGSFGGTVDFDPGPGTFNLTASGGADIFISKLDAAGNFIWAKRMGGVLGDLGLSIVIDEALNVYTTGFFNGTADFDPGPGMFNLTAAGGQDIFISKLDAAGNFVWAKRIGGTFDDQARSITLDALGNVYTTGFFDGTVDFDPGPGVFNLTAADGGAFVSKLDAAGNFVWAKSISGPSLNTSALGEAVVLDAAGNVYIAGGFRGNVDFDPGPGTFILNADPVEEDAFVAKWDASGNFVWAKQIRGDRIDIARDMILDASGNVYITGVFYGTTDFDPGPGTFTLSTAGFSDGFVSKLDAAGNFVWVKQMGGPGFDGSESIAVDATGNLYTTGDFQATVDFDPGPGTFNLTSAGAYDIFISKLNTAGNFVWARKMGGSSFDDVGTSVKVDATGTIYTTGRFNGIANFDPGPGVFNLTAIGDADIFVVKWAQVANPGTDACPKDTTIILTSCTGTTTVAWAAPRDTFPASIQVTPGLVPAVLSSPGEGRLNFLGATGSHGYYRSTDAYRWPTANNIATSFPAPAGGHLATLTSAAENAFITPRLQSEYGYFSWIGLRRTGTGPTQFQWVTGEPFSYTNWGPLDPNNFGGSATNLVEPYVHLYEGSGRWHDLLDAPLPFLAEFDTTLIRWRQISGPANGSSLGVGTYTVCYERTNVITNQRDTCCFTVTVQCSNTLITQAVQDAGKVKERVAKGSLKVIAHPNPASNYFTLQLSSGDSRARVRIRVVDVTGRTVEQKQGVAANRTLQIGRGYRPGVYLVEVVQGSLRQTVQLVKQGD